MNIGQFLFVAKEVLGALEAAGVLRSDGQFDFSNFAGDAALIKSVADIVKAHGVVLPPKVDQLLLALPILITFFK